jgi:photosystem II stability/assembly factor-like uncharacterized protein
MEFRVRSFLTALALLLLTPGLLPAQGNPAWQPLGPWGGTVGSIAVHPTDPQVLYAGGSLAGVVKSTDGGASWRLLPGSPFLPAFVALDPGRPTTVYAAERFAGHVFKSTDGGAHWRRISAGLPRDLEISGLAVDPLRPSRLYLGSQSRGVWRSVDGGASWQRASQGLPAGGNLQVTLVTAGRPAGTAFVNAVPHGLFRTRDAGASWKPARNGLPAASQVFALAIAPSDPRTLYASFADRVYRSENGGGSWVPAGQPPGGPTLAALAVHPRSPRTVYGGTANSGIFKSEDGGRTWEPTGAPTAVYVATLAFGSSRQGPVYAGLAFTGTDPGGVMRSADGGATWERRRQGIPGLSANSVAIDPADPDNLATAVETGLYRSANGGVRFARTRAGFPVPSGFGVLIGQVQASGPGTFYAVDFRQPALWKSTDAGLTWRLLPGPAGLPVLRLRTDPLDPDTLYAVARSGLEWRIYRSNDGGLSWTPLAVPSAHCGFTDLAVARPSASSPAVLYLGGTRSSGSSCLDSHSALFRSSDGGASWTGASAGLPGEFVSAVTVDPQDSRVVYAGIGGRTVPGVDLGVWKSTDSGATWQLSGLPRLPILALAASPVPGVVWASSGDSVYRSGDAGATWQDWSGGQVLWQVRDFAFDPSDPERVYIAGFGGVWVTHE